MNHDLIPIRRYVDADNSCLFSSIAYLIDPKNLKPTTYGIDYMKTYGMGLLKNKNVKDITDADLTTIQLNIENQIKRENKLGKKTESFLRNRQKFIKNVDELENVSEFFILISFIFVR